MEKKFIAAVRRGNDAVVFELGPSMGRATLEQALEIATIMNMHGDAPGELDAIVNFLEKLLDD
jgi:hypothetical protein